MTSVCTIRDDYSFGPVVKCSQFDFTLTFEQSIFGIAIHAFLLLVFPFRIWRIYGAPIKTYTSPVYIAKTTIALVVVGLQVAILVLWTKRAITRVAIVAAVIELLSALVVVVLVVFEYQRTTRPSKLTSTYLLTALMSDGVLIRTLYMRNYLPHLNPVVTTSAACKVVLLLLESWPKTAYVKPTDAPLGKIDVASPINRAFMWWMNPILIYGNTHILTLSDLYPIDHDLRSEGLRTRMQKAWTKYKSKADISKGKFPMVWAGIACLKWPLLQTVPPRAGMIAISYAQTFLITAAITYLETPAPLRDVRHAYGLIGAAAIIYVGNALLSTNYMYHVFRMIAMFRGATASVIYTKALSSDANHNQMAAVTLMSTDVDRIAFSLIQVTELWAQVTQIALGIWLLWRQLGPTAIAPTLLAFLCFGIQIQLAKRMGPSQAEWVQSVQRRVGVTSTVLRSMKSVKLAGLVESMGDLVQAERVREIKKAMSFRWIMVITQGFAQLPTLLSSLVVFAAFAIEAKIKGTAPLTTAQAFTSLSVLALLTQPSMMLLQSAPQVAAAIGCIYRVQKFLSAKGFQDSRSFSSKLEHIDSSDENFPDVLEKPPRLSDDCSEYPISVTELMVKPSPDWAQTPNPITFRAKRGTVTMILGPVGSGKSTLLKAILGELTPESGTVEVSTPFMAYCSQSPWLQNCPIRENIIGTRELDRDWYRTIVRVCDLEEDFSNMPQKDLTIIGSRGITLSGGQKHRVALARALYSRCSLLVLDDFFSAIDRKTQRSIAHALFSTKEGHVVRHGCTLLLATHITTYVHHADSVVILDANGVMTYSGPTAAWIATMDDIAKGQDEELPEEPEKAFDSEDWEGDAILEKIEGGKFDENVETIKRQKGDLAVWKYYGKSIGGLSLILTAAWICINVFSNNFQRLWLQWNTGTRNPDLGKFLGVYAMLVVFAFVFQILMMGQVLLVMGPRSARYLHKILVKSTIHAPMSFFEATDSSILLNRFSQDMTLVDFNLPMSSYMVFLQLANCIMSIALISYGSSFMAATVPAAIFALYWIQRFYLRTSRQMRLLDLETKTPLYQHFTETLEGVATIRAFGWQEPFDQSALRKLNNSQRPYFLMYCIQRWLSLVLGLLVAAIAIILVALALCVPQHSSGGNLGVALNSVLAFNMGLTMLISAWTEAETSLGSVARTESFEKHTPVEQDPEDPLDPGMDWPHGALDVSGLGFTYSDGTTALKDVSFSITKGQKLGICGRTGSGKSTLLASFLRLIDPSDGTISVDGIDISRLTRATVRDRLICLPQDALVFFGSFQFNLDPEDRAPDTGAMIDVLKSVGLWNLVEGRGGLGADLKPESLSHGEQQLLALARAVLRKRVAKGKCILILDEATSNLDSASEAVVQKVIREEFKDNTVITVAHRLDTIKDADAVLMLDKGAVVRLGPPSEIWQLMGVRNGDGDAAASTPVIE